MSSELGWTPAQSYQDTAAERCVGVGGAAIDKQSPDTRNPICLLSYRSLYPLIKAPASEAQDKVCLCIIVDSSKSNLIEACLIIMGTIGDTDIHNFNAGSTRSGVTCEGHKNASLC